jgi:hypothetical protein
LSHHLDTPLARQNGQLYIDDLYVFAGTGIGAGSETGTGTGTGIGSRIGTGSTVFVMDVNSTITRSDVQRGFHPEARYEFKVHFNGADFEALTYRVSFGEADTDGRQSLQLYALTGAEACEDGAVGTRVLQGRTGETVTGPDTRLWAGRIADPFYIDLSLLNMVNTAVRKGTAVDLSGWRPGKAQNSFAGTTVESIVLEVSQQHPQLRPGTHISVWCATKLATDARGWRQINRAGHPMMWPIFWPDDTAFTNPANTRHPSADYEAVGTYIGDKVAAAVAASGTAADPQGYGQAVGRELFPDVVSYEVGTPATYSFAARNGRTLADNAPEAMLSLVLNMAVPSGLKPSVSQQLRAKGFPYVVASSIPASSIPSMSAGSEVSQP